MDIERTRPSMHSPLRLKGRFQRARSCVMALVAGVCALAGMGLARGAVLLPDSVRPVEKQGAEPARPHKPFISRSTLKAEESAAPMRFEVALKLRNMDELEARITKGEIISPEELAAKYEPLASDYDAVVNWLTSSGMTINRTDAHHIGVFATGRVDQIGKQLGVTFARVMLDGTEYTSAVSEPAVPEAIAPKLIGINGLQPHIRAHRHYVLKQGITDQGPGTAPYFPSQVAQAYQATSLYSNGVEGYGQTIAIMIDTFPYPADLELFWRTVGVPQSISNMAFIQVIPGVMAPPQIEETLDTEWSSSIAPGAHVRVYAFGETFTSADIDAAYAQLLSDVTTQPTLGIHQMSMSYGFGEAYTTNAAVQTADAYFAELTAVGVTCFASSGDDGSTPGPYGTGDTSGPVQVDNPASDPNVTAVGGTQLILNQDNDEVSETVWNDPPGDAASGGGASIYFPRPSWQNKGEVGMITSPYPVPPSTPAISGSNREVPDVCASADPYYGAVLEVYGQEETVGGTSWSSPTWAGFCALMNSARANLGQKPLGMLQPKIYPLLDGSANLSGSTTTFANSSFSKLYPLYFRDITVGNNVTGNSNGLWVSGTGYDLCTGLGAPLVTPLTQFLTNTSQLIGIEDPSAVEHVEPGQNAAFTVTVTGTTATYQWQLMPILSSTWTNLTDGGPYTGSVTPTLTIGQTTTAMSGNQFQCLVTAGTTTITTSPPSVLVVDTPFAITTIAGQDGIPGTYNGPGNGARFNYPSGLALDGSGDVYVADFDNNQIREISTGDSVSVPYGQISANAGAVNGVGNNSSFFDPNDVAIDGTGNVYVADSGNNLVRKINTAGLVTTFSAGTALEAFLRPEGVAVDGSGNVYVADSGNDVIWKVIPTGTAGGGTATLIAGEYGVAGYVNGKASTAEFNDPVSVAVDSFGHIFVADLGNDVIREISGTSAATYTVSTAAGQAHVTGYIDGLETKALFNRPIGLAIDGSNNIYVADSQVPPVNSTDAGNDILRRVTPTGVVSTLAGGVGVDGTDDGTGGQVQFYSLQGLAITGTGPLYIADTYNQVIREGVPSNMPVVVSVISLSGSLAFGNVDVNLTATNTLVISNSGNSVLTVTNISYPGGFSGDWTGAVPAGSSQDVPVTFSPTAAIPYGGNIVVESDATTGTSAIAVSGTGISFSLPPTVLTGGVTGVTGTSAVLKGTVNPEGTTAMVYFNYGLTGTYGSVTAVDNAGSAATDLPFAVEAVGLQPLTTYHYQAVATNAGNTVYGSDETFTTGEFSTNLFGATGNFAVNLSGSLTGMTYMTLLNPVINSQNNVAFAATLTKGYDGVTATDDSGIWADNSSNTLEMIAQTSGSAPGTNGGQYMVLTGPAYNDNEAVAFIGKLELGGTGSVTSSDASGVWSTSSGSLELVARQGSQAPGFPLETTFKTFNSIALPDAGGALFDATVSSGGATGIWAGDTTANLHLISKVGQTIGGKTVSKITFLPPLPYVSGQNRSFAETTGTVAYLATFTDKSTGIVEVNGTNPVLIIASTDAAPGGGDFKGFGNPAVNENGYVAFSATSTSGEGVWADDDTGTLQLVAGEGQTAPGASATFRSAGDPVYSGSEAVAFRGTLKTGGGVTSANSTGIWSNGSGALALVARAGSQAPGCATGVTFKAFTAVALSDQGNAVFAATLNTSSKLGVTSANNSGIWAQTPYGTELIVRTGQSVNGQTVKTLTFLPVLKTIGGESRNISQSTGNLLYQATFTNKTSSIYTVIFPQ